MMDSTASSSDVFGKLSRIFETHVFTKDTEGLSGFIDEFEDEYRDEIPISPNRNSAKKKGDSSTNDKKTPFEAWKSRQKVVVYKQPPKLTGEQWDKLVDKMHQSNRTKQSSIMERQNEGLALELGGYQFKPRINKVSLEKCLDNKMQPLLKRMPKMIADKERLLEIERQQRSEQETAECTFTPTRKGAKVSNMYLKRMGRDKATPEDFFKYKEEKTIRNELRQQIKAEIEQKELTFKPKLSEKTIQLQQKLKKQGVIDIDPLTRMSVVKHNALLATTTAAAASMRGSGSEAGISVTPSGLEKIRKLTNNDLIIAATDLFEGPMLVIESEHPYRHNTNEYINVQIPGAVAYSISFHENTRTEAIYDYIKFYDDDKHTHQFGANKYSGGTNDTHSNWPGLQNRPPLIINAPKFIIYFKTNGTINDWGFRMHIIPTISITQSQPNNMNALSRIPPNHSEVSKNYRNNSNGNDGTTVHDRLYQKGVEKVTEAHNNHVELMQSKLNVAIKPWENLRNPNDPQSAHKYIKMNSKSHVAKATLLEAVEELVYDDPPFHRVEQNESNNYEMDSLATSHRPFMFGVVEFNDSLGKLWKDLRTALPVNDNDN
eukprot:gene4688-6584_t